MGPRHQAPLKKRAQTRQRAGSQGLTGALGGRGQPRSPSEERSLKTQPESTRPSQLQGHFQLCFLLFLLGVTSSCARCLSLAVLAVVAEPRMTATKLASVVSLRPQSVL